MDARAYRSRGVYRAWSAFWFYASSSRQWQSDILAIRIPSASEYSLCASARGVARCPTRTRQSRQASLRRPRPCESELAICSPGSRCADGNRTRHVTSAGAHRLAQYVADRDDFSHQLLGQCVGHIRCDGPQWSDITKRSTRRGRTGAGVRSHRRLVTHSGRDGQPACGRTAVVLVAQPASSSSGPTSVPSTHIADRLRSFGSTQVSHGVVSVRTSFGGRRDGNEMDCRTTTRNPSMPSPPCLRASHSASFPRHRRVRRFATTFVACGGAQENASLPFETSAEPVRWPTHNCATGSAWSPLNRGFVSSRIATPATTSPRYSSVVDAASIVGLENPMEHCRHFRYFVCGVYVPPRELVAPTVNPTLCYLRRLRCATPSSIMCHCDLAV